MCTSVKCSHNAPAARVAGGPVAFNWREPQHCEASAAPSHAPTCCACACHQYNRASRKRAAPPLSPCRSPPVAYRAQRNPAERPSARQLHELLRECAPLYEEGLTELPSMGLLPSMAGSGSSGSGGKPLLPSSWEPKLWEGRPARGRQAWEQLGSGEGRHSGGSRRSSFGAQRTSGGSGAERPAVMAGRPNSGASPMSRVSGAAGRAGTWRTGSAPLPHQSELCCQPARCPPTAPSRSVGLEASSLLPMCPALPAGGLFGR